VIVAVGRRKAHDENDIYELAKKLLRLNLSVLRERHSFCHRFSLLAALDVHHVVKRS